MYSSNGVVQFERVRIGLAASGFNVDIGGKAATMVAGSDATQWTATYELSVDDSALEGSLVRHDSPQLLANIRQWQL